jgi:hypothetical protein
MCMRIALPHVPVTRLLSVSSDRLGTADIKYVISYIKILPPHPYTMHTLHHTLFYYLEETRTG